MNTRKQLRIRINNLIDQHGHTFEKCKGCPICKEIHQLQESLMRDPEQKYQHILSKGQDMTKSDIAALLDGGVQLTLIKKHLRISSNDFSEMIQQWGFSKRKRKDEEEMAKISYEEYQDYKAQGKSDKEIAALKGMNASYLPALKKKWSANQAEANHAIAKAENRVEEKKLPEIKTTPKENNAKSAENERLIAALRNDLNTYHAQLEEKDEQIRSLRHQQDLFKKAIAEKNDYILTLQNNVQDLENLHAACEDIENELASLKEENEKLKKELMESKQQPAITQEDIDLFEKVREENLHLRALLKLWM